MIKDGWGISWQMDGMQYVVEVVHIYHPFVINRYDLDKNPGILLPHSGRVLRMSYEECLLHAYELMRPGGFYDPDGVQLSVYF